MKPPERPLVRPDSTEVTGLRAAKLRARSSVEGLVLTADANFAPDVDNKGGVITCPTGRFRVRFENPEAKIVRVGDGCLVVSSPVKHALGYWYNKKFSVVPYRGECPGVVLPRWAGGDGTKRTHDALISLSLLGSSAAVIFRIADGVSAVEGPRCARCFYNSEQSHQPTVNIIREDTGSAVQGALES